MEHGRWRWRRIVARDPTAAASITKQHIAADLITQAGVRLVDGEPDLIERLAVRVKWAGRYPVPKTVPELVAAREGILWQNVLRVSSGDGALVNGLFDRMRAELESIISQLKFARAQST